MHQVKEVDAIVTNMVMVDFVLLFKQIIDQMASADVQQKSTIGFSAQTPR